MRAVAAAAASRSQRSRRGRVARSTFILSTCSWSSCSRRVSTGRGCSVFSIVGGLPTGSPRRTTTMKAAMAMAAMAAMAEEEAAAGSGMLRRPPRWLVVGSSLSKYRSERVSATRTWAILKRRRAAGRRYSRGGRALGITTIEVKAWRICCMRSRTAILGARSTTRRWSSTWSSRPIHYTRIRYVTAAAAALQHIHASSLHLC